jgi:UDP-glucuronate decarboxylase
MTRWITERLGTSPWGNCEQNADTTVVDVRTLRDATGNPPDLIRRYVNTAVAHWHAGRTVVICCDYGVSRSNAVAAGVLAILKQKSYDDAIIDVIAATGEQQIKLDVAIDVRAALGGQVHSSSSGGTFVIGGEGFIGRSLKRALGNDCVECPTTTGATLTANPVLLNAFLGGQAPERLVFCWHPPQLDTNVAAGALISGLRNMLEVCRLLGMSIVFVSGHQVFAARNDDAPYRCAEDETPRPAGAAGDGLYLAEKLIEMYASRHNLEALIIRPTHLYGANDERPSFLNTFMRKAVGGVDIDTHQFTNGAPCIDLLHVDDFASGVALAIRTGVSGILHLASGSCLSSGELANEVLHAAGGQGAVRVVNLSGRCSRTMLDASMARRILGWKPEIVLAEGLRDALEHIKINMPNKEGIGSK